MFTLLNGRYDLVAPRHRSEMMMNPQASYLLARKIMLREHREANHVGRNKAEHDVPMIQKGIPVTLYENPKVIEFAALSDFPIRSIS